jgi:hypothetical protein
MPESIHQSLQLTSWIIPINFFHKSRGHLHTLEFIVCFSVFNFLYLLIL